MRELKNLLEKIDLAARRHALFSSGDAVLAGVSGGPDSTALLLLLTKIQKKYNFRIGAAYLNHGLLPRQAARHENFVCDLSKKMGVEFYSKRVDVRRLAHSSKRSIEEAGRDARY